TSVAASFPRTDWQLTANSSANGGASKFSIDDISGSRTPFTVEANARSHSLYVDDGGRIGNRTSTPSTEIHTIDGDTPTLRLQQDGSSGFAPQTWDLAGNETNFFVRDVSNGSTLPLRIRPGAPTSAIFIDVDGDVGMGTASPDNSLHVTGTAGDTMVLIEEDSGSSATRELLELRNNGIPRLILDNSGTDDGDGNSTNGSGTDDGRWFFGLNANDNFVISLFASPTNEVRVDKDGDMIVRGDVTANGVLLTSDRNLKTDISNLDGRDVLAAVSQLPISSWRFKADDAVRHIGPMAQDFHALFGLGPDDRHISPLDASGVALAAVQGLNQEVQEKDDRIGELEAKNAELEARLAALEAMIGAIAEADGQ
ncbi:MAG: tail fiber domain-containing protein, partial [Acidobacteriota bacterium]